MAHQVPFLWKDNARPSVSILGSVEGLPKLHSDVIACMDRCRMMLERPSVDQASVKGNPDIIYRSLPDKHLFPKKKPFKEATGQIDSVLKPTWIDKRINQESAVVMFMPFGIDWNSEEWATAERRAGVRYSSIWSASSSYGYALILVAVQIGQPGGPAHPDRDGLNERLERFKSNINIDPQLFLQITEKDLAIHETQSSPLASPSSTIGVSTVMQKLFRLIRDSSLAYCSNQVKRSIQTMEYRASQVGFGGATRANSRTQELTTVGIIRAKYSLKAGIYSEYNGMLEQAMSYYRKGFHSLISIIENTRESLLNQVQYWTEFAHFKIVQQLLVRRQLHDAIEQLEAFMASMKGHFIEKTSFIHYGWLSKQYITFLDLVEEYYSDGMEGDNGEGDSTASTSAISQKDKAILQVCRSQFYISASKLEGRRKNEFQKLRKSSAGRLSILGTLKSPLSITPLVLPLTAEQKKEKRKSIFNVRSRRSSTASSISFSEIQEALAAASSTDGETTEMHESELLPDEQLQGVPQGEIVAADLESEEASIDHFSQVMTLLEKALRCTPPKHKRRRAHVQAQMAEELMGQGNFARASECLAPAISSLCKERWIPLVVPLLRKQMACSVYLGRAEDYLTASMKLYGLAGPVLLTRYEREELHRDILSVMTSSGRQNNFTSESLEDDTDSRAILGRTNGSHSHAHESIFLRPEYGMAAPAGSELPHRLPHGFVFNTSSMHDCQTKVFIIDVDFDHTKAIEIGEPVHILLRIKSLFHGRMKFAELIIHWSDQLAVQRVVSPEARDAFTERVMDDEVQEAPLEFENNKEVTIPLTLELPESRLSKILGSSKQECFAVVESIDFVLRSSFEKEGELDATLEHSKSTEIPTSSNDTATMEGVKRPISDDIPGETVSDDIPGETVSDDIPGETVSDDTPGETVSDDIPGETVSDDIPSAVSEKDPLEAPPVFAPVSEGKDDGFETVDFILKCHTVPEKILRRRRHDEALGIAPTTYEDYAVTPLRRRNNTNVKMQGTATASDQLTPNDSQDFRVLHIVKPRGQVTLHQHHMRRANNNRFGCTLTDAPKLDIDASARNRGKNSYFVTQGVNVMMGKASAKPSKKELLEAKKKVEMQETEAHFTILKDSIQRINIVFSTNGNAVSCGKVYLSSNIDCSSGDGQNDLFWYPHVHEVISKERDLENMRFHPMRKNDSFQPGEPILLPEQGPQSIFTIPLFLYSPIEQEVEIRLNMEYIPHESIYSSLIKEFIVHVKFVQALSCEFEITPHGFMSSIAALGFERVNEGAEASLQEESQAAVLRGETMTLCTKITCLNSLKGSLSIHAADFILPHSDSFVSNEGFDKFGGKAKNQSAAKDAIFEILDDSDLPDEGKLAEIGFHASTSAPPLGLGALIEETAELTQSETFVGALDMLCLDNSPAQTDEELCDILGSSNTFNEVKRDECHGLNVCVGKLLVKWCRENDDIFLPIASLTSIHSARSSPPGSQASIKSMFRSDSNGSNMDAAGSKGDLSSYKGSAIIDYDPNFSWLPSLGALSQTLGVESFAPSTDLKGRDDSHALNLSVARYRVSESAFDACTLRVLDSPFKVVVELASFGNVGVPMTCQVHIKSNLKTAQKLTLTVPGLTTNSTVNNATDSVVSSSDTSGSSSPILQMDFLVTGPVKQSLQILPGDSHVIDMSFIPVKCGYIHAPEIALLWPHCGQKVFELKRSIFVSPSEKGS